MESTTILFYLLNGSPAIDIKNKDGDILPFLYELFTKFDHDLNPNDKSICLKPIQRNTEIMRDAVKELIERYAEKNPAIRQLNKIFAQMTDGEYFMIIVNHKPDHNEMYERYAILMKMNFSDFDIEKHMSEGAELFKNIWDNYDLYITRSNTRQIIGEKDRHRRTCRFCG